MCEALSGRNIALGTSRETLEAVPFRSALAKFSTSPCEKQVGRLYLSNSLTSAWEPGLECFVQPQNPTLVLLPAIQALKMPQIKEIHTSHTEKSFSYLFLLLLCTLNVTKGFYGRKKQVIRIKSVRQMMVVFQPLRVTGLRSCALHHRLLYSQV